MMLEAGVPEKKIVVTGTTIFNHLKPRVKRGGLNVLFRPAHWDTFDIYENIMVARALRSMRGINVTTKTVETQSQEGFDNVVNSVRDEEGHLEICAELLSKTDVVVGIGGDGTLDILAYALDIPVVIPDVWHNRPFLGKDTPDMIYSEAGELIEMKDLEKTIREVAKNPEKKREERRRVAISWGGVDIENPLENIINAINNVHR